MFHFQKIDAMVQTSTHYGQWLITINCCGIAQCHAVMDNFGNLVRIDDWR